MSPHKSAWPVPRPRASGDMAMVSSSASSRTARMIAKPAASGAAKARVPGAASNSEISPALQGRPGKHAAWIAAISSGFIENPGRRVGGGRRIGGAEIERGGGRHFALPALRGDARDGFGRIMGGGSLRRAQMFRHLVCRCADHGEPVLGEDFGSLCE